MFNDKGRLRILTPVERERLMGFPDNWTEGVSDDQRFKQTGNAVIIKVAEAVIRRLVECHGNQGRRPDAKAIGQHS
jgi:DNA (cytosine-5)-methyltransferase 1